jgi:CBS domain-containing protein
VIIGTGSGIIFYFPVGSSLGRESPSVPTSMTARDVMDFKVTFIDATASVFDAIKLMVSSESWSIIVETGGLPVSVVTDRDLLRRCLANGKDSNRTKIEEIMSSPIISVSPHEHLGKIIDTMAEKNIRRIFVVENGKIIGKITQTRLFDNSINVLESLSGLRYQL